MTTQSSDEVGRRSVALASTGGPRALLLGCVLATAPLLGACLDFDRAYDDVARRLDAGAPDAGTADAGTADAGTDDAGTDAGVTDAGVTDAGVTDAGVTDAGETDAGVTDAGADDAGTTDAGVVDAGVRCGPFRLQARSVFLDDAGLNVYVGSSSAGAQVLIAGLDALSDGSARQLPGGPLLPLPQPPVMVTGRDGVEFFTTDFGGGGWFRLDAGYSSAMTGACAADFAGAVHSPRPGVAVYCDEATFAACLLTNGTPSRLAPAFALPGLLSCSTITLSADGGLLRGGAVRPDAGGLNSEAVLVGADGLRVPLPAGEGGISALAAFDADAPFIITDLGEVLARRDGGWTRSPSRDGGTFRTLVPFPGSVALVLGARNAVAWFDGQTFCEARIEGLPPGWLWSWLDGLRAGGELVTTGSASFDGGPSRGAAAVLELTPW